MPKYAVDIDASVSDMYVITAKNSAEAKRKALKRFCKLKNFRFDVEKIKPGEEDSYYYY